MKKGIVAAVIATMLTTATLACPTMPTYCTCGMCGTGYQAQQTIQQTACYDRTGEGYYDASGHYCEYGGYWDGGCWIQTVGYWEGGEWCPAQYDPALEVGYYDECGGYHLYGGCQGMGYGYVYGENDIWACDNRRWLEEQDYGSCEYGYEDWGYEDWGYGYEDCNYGYGDCGYGYEDCGYYIDLDLDADVISVVNNGVIIFSGTCTCADIYRGQELAFNSQRCMGIWNTCSGGFYEQACGYQVERVCCH